MRRSPVLRALRASKSRRPSAVTPILMALVTAAHIAAPMGLPSAAMAQQTPSEDVCNDPLTQYEMNYCADRDWRMADEDLNATYVWAMERAKAWSEEAAIALRDAQRAWIPYRDRACEAEGILFEGGSIQPLIVMSCKAHLTRLRTEDIRAIYEQN